MKSGKNVGNLLFLFKGRGIFENATTKCPKFLQRFLFCCYLHAQLSLKRLSNWLFLIKSSLTMALFVKSRL